MQELKDDIIIEKKLGFITENSCNRILDYIDNLYLEKEKEQIEEAYSQGYGDGVQEPNPNDEYYKQTYKQLK